MPQTLWSAPVGPLGNVSGTAVSTAGVLTDASPPPPNRVDPGLINLGTEMRVRAHGELTSSATPTVTFGIYWQSPGGAIGTAVVIAVTAAQTLSASFAAWPWMLEWDGEFRALSTGAGGNTGSVNGMGKLHLGSSLTAFSAPAAFPVTKALRTVALDTSISKTVMLGVNTSATTASVTCDDLIVELLG